MTNNKSNHWTAQIDFETQFKWLVLAFHLMFFVVYCHDPFYGDAKSTISRLAYQIYESNFYILFYPQGMDPGHPITFPILHAFLWKIFGSNLIVSHSFQLFFTLLTLFGIHKLDKQFKAKGWFMLLCGFNPVFIAMASGLNTHMALLAMMIFFLIGLFNQNIWLKTACIALLLITHNQGMLLAVVLLGIDLFHHKNVKATLIQCIGFAPWIIWLLLHKNATGWYLFPPEYAEFRGVGSPKILFKNALIIIWRLADFGQFIILFFAFGYIYKNIRYDKKWISIALIGLGIIAATWLSVKFSIAHRYFIFATIIFSLPAALALQKQKTTIQILSVILLLSGSFWYYPGKQLADANIQYRHYFKLYTSIQSEAELNKKAIFSTPPNESPSWITHLSKNGDLLDIKPLDSVINIGKSAILMHGNVCGSLPKEVLDSIENWNFLTVQSGSAFVNLYSPHPFSQELVHKYPKRTNSWVELKMQKLKKQLQ